MTYAQACAKLPADASISCSFGFPAHPGYVEMHRDPSGKVYEITNGRGDTTGEVWTFAVVK
jgi:hypothetical protein